jgi:hypothetical protein
MSIDRWIGAFSLAYATLSMLYSVDPLSLVGLISFVCGGLLVVWSLS